MLCLAFIHVLSYILLISCCDGSSLLYVRPDDYTLCPDHSEYCLTLSEYAQDLPHYLGPNTTLAFLPGHHILDTVFNITGSVSAALKFMAHKAGRPTQITCTTNASFVFLHMDMVMFADLDIYYGSGNVSTAIIAESITCLLFQSCNIRDSLTIMLYMYNTNMVSTSSKFLYNHGSDPHSPWFALIDANASFVDCTFASNLGSGMYLLGSSVTFSGTNSLANNCGISGGAITASNTTLIFTGNTTFTNNSASYGGAVYAASSLFHFCENSTTTFVNNTAIHGDGGAVFLEGNSKLNYRGLNVGSVRFQNNTANRGGALYVQDSNPLTYCLNRDDYYITALQDCFYGVPANYSCVPARHKIMHFNNNKAKEAGHGLYGGAIYDACEKCRFNDITSISDDPMEISSDPYIVCACNSTGPDCSQPSISLPMFPGGSFSVSVIALGQKNGPAAATILAMPDTQIQIGELESAHLISNKCTHLTYTIFSTPGSSGSVLLYAEGPCLTLGTNLTIDVQVSKCPPGFKLIKANGTCTCNDRLQQYTDDCNVVDQTITRDGAFWVGYDNASKDVILYPNCPFDYCARVSVSFRLEDCPFDYCARVSVSFRLEDYNAQCRYNRTGLLCGGCREGLSLLLGSSRCGKCSNSHLGLLVFFAVAGVLLVVFLLTFNVTVAVGTISGLIFYANVVGSNQAIFFPKESTTYLDVLKVFIAWINLDFGIESCFYNGMDAYHRAWLQYAFPTYIWSLIVLVFVVSHFSQRASRILGSNPVAVLATLMLLSYTKVLRTITEVLNSASLEYPYGKTKLVWIYDGNVPFFGGKHLVLFVFSVLVLTFLFIPYTLLLLTSQWLQIKSHWKILSWLNKPQLRAFLDAYHAPYKPRHRYWTGLLLLVRFALLLVSALNTDSNPAVSLLVAFIFVLVIFTWQWISGGVYKNWCLEVLDSFFLLNIVFLVINTYYVNYDPPSSQFLLNSGERSQESGTATLVTASLVVFVGLVAYHGYLRVRGTATWKTAVRKMTKHNGVAEEKEIPAAKEDSGLLPIQAPTRSYVAI